MSASKSIYKNLTITLSLLLTPIAQAENNYCPMPDQYLQSTNSINKILKQDPFAKFKAMLAKEKLMSQDLQQKVMTILDCASKDQIYFRPILTVIDFSLPANQKRLWVFDLKQMQLLDNTYVSHGIKSGRLNSSFFSNRNNSKSSSIGVYKTGNAYYGRHGYSLKLQGLENGFNSNAYNRFIVMHGGWYVSEDFVNKFGRPGRSWGCPALPRDKVHDIIGEIKDEALLIAYYPGEKWLSSSRFLQCRNYSALPDQNNLKTIRPVNESRSDILYVDKNHNHRWNINEAVLVSSADDYRAIFNKSAPLDRMIRRPINEKAYVALNADEFQFIVKNHPEMIQHSTAEQRKVFFIIPEVKNVRGYWATEMKIIEPGTITAISDHYDQREDNPSAPAFKLHRKNHQDWLVAKTHQFIRWLGL